MNCFKTICFLLLMIFTIDCYGALPPEPPLHQAAKTGDLAHVQSLITTPGININARDTFGKSPLHLAASNRRLNIIQALIIAGAHIDAQDNYGWTPLHEAADNGSLKTAKALIVAGANINAQENSGWTPAQMAAMIGNYVIASYITECEQLLQEARARTRKSMRTMVQVQHPRLGEHSPAQTLTQLPLSLIGFFVKQAEEFDAVQSTQQDTQTPQPAAQQPAQKNWNCIIC